MVKIMKKYFHKYFCQLLLSYRLMIRRSVIIILLSSLVLAGCGDSGNEYASTDDYMKEWIKSISNRQEELLKPYNQYEAENYKIRKKQADLAAKFETERLLYVERMLEGVKSFYAKELIRELESIKTKKDSKRIQNIKKELMIYYTRDYERYLKNCDGDMVVGDDDPGK